MDTVAISRRLAQAREAAGKTREEVSRAVGLDEPSLGRLESGEQQGDVRQLGLLAREVQRPLSFLLDADVPSVVGRRSSDSGAHHATNILDTELQHFGADLRRLIELGLLVPAHREQPRRTPRNHDEAERSAQRVRDLLGLGDDPVADLGSSCERLGLYTYSTPLGVEGPDGGCVEVDSGAGAAVINGEAPAGRRRMTLAHELGHWLLGDAYDAAAPAAAEKMINSFAAHFLAPRAGVHGVWKRHGSWDARDRALAVGASFRMSWSAAVGQLRTIRLINVDEWEDLRSAEPRRGDYLRLGLSWADELGSPYLSTGFARGCIEGYATSRLTQARAIEMLGTTLPESELPQRSLTRDDLRASFAGHGG